MSDTLTDPFSAAAAGIGQPQLPSQQPGMLGISPSTWENIAQLGAGAIQGANQRTADGHLANGTGIAGGVMGAAQGYFGDIQKQAQLRSLLASQGASTQGKQIENETNALNLPLARARNQFQIRALQDPNLLGSIGYGGDTGPLQGSPASGQVAPAGGDGASYVNNTLEGGAGKNPRSSASGYGQLIDANKNAFATANPQYFQGASTPEAKNARFNDPAVGTAATNWMAQQNAPILSQAGVPITGPNLAMAHRLGAQAVPAVARAADTEHLLTTLASSIGPQKALAYAIANPEMARQTVGQFRAQFTNVPAYGPAANGGGGPGDSLLQQADALTARANRIAGAQAQAKLVGLPPGPGMAVDPSALHTQAQQLRETGLKLNSAGPEAGATARAQADVKLATAGPISMAEKGYAMAPGGTTAQAVAGGPADPEVVGGLERAKAQNQATTIRGPGSGSIIPNGPGQAPTIVQSPLEKKILGPDNREWSITQNAIEDGKPYVRPEGVPSWAPPGTLTAVPQGLSPTEEASQKEASEDAFGERANRAYQGAVTTIGNMEMVRQNLAQLNSDPNFLSTGPGGQFKQHMAATLNANLENMGLPTMFDPSKVAAGESLEHQARIGGMQAVSALMGASHEAASVVQSTQAAFPNADNTPLGAKVLTAGIDNAAKYVADRHVFISNWVQQNPGKSLIGADTAFQAQRPAQKYTMRAISMGKPYEVSPEVGLNGLSKRFLPGTRVMLKGGDGKVRIVPGDESLAPVGTDSGQQ